MGPIALFDKSFLQSLSVDESVWFDHYFTANICPLFYVETLADLNKKNVREGRTPEQEVAIIAEKTPEVSGGSNAHHRDLCIANLMGHRIPMRGQIPVAGGRPVKSGGKTGYIYEPSPESKAFNRWQHGQFKEVEHMFASEWREMLTNLDLEATASAMRALGINPKTCKSLENAFAIAENIVIARKNPFDQIKLVFAFLSIPRELHREIIERWSIDQYRQLSEYAPYVAHVLKVELFFQICLAANLIPSSRSSNRIDIAYLFYLPFCMIFVSSDKLHRKCASFFMRNDQDFVWGLDLKPELQRINEHFAAMPEHDRELGVLRLSRKPVGDDESLLIRLWDRHAQNWRDTPDTPRPANPEVDAKILSQLKELNNAKELMPHEVDFDTENVDQLSLGRMVRKRKGSWWQLPKDLEIPPMDKKD